MPKQIPWWVGGIFMSLLFYFSFSSFGANRPTGASTGMAYLSTILFGLDSQNKNKSFSTSFSMITPLMNTLSAISQESNHYTKDAFIAEFDVDSELLERLLNDEILMPINDNDFTEKEASIMKLVGYFNEVGIEYDILKLYVFHAKALSLLEHQIQTKLCDVRNDENFSVLWKIIFGTLFNAKEYIFNRQTYKAFFSTLKSEILN